jgi:PPOX class probable F420-dependent enzyme
VNWRPWDTRTFASTPAVSKTGSSSGSRQKADTTNEGGSKLTTQDHLSMISQSHQDLLGSTAPAHVATIGPKGVQQNNPVWFDWDGEHARFSQTKAHQKYRNLHRDPRIALSIVDPDDPFRYLEIRGAVERIEEDADLALINSMAKKYLSEDEYRNHRPGDERVVVLVKPQHTTKMGR